jgi:hypothetical protein
MASEDPMRNTLLAVVAVAAAAAHSGIAFAQFVEGTHRIHVLAPNIYAAQPRFGGSSATFIVDDARVVVFDPHSTPAQAGALIEEIRHRTDAPVKLVINSHWHADHHGGNNAFARAFPGVELLAHRETLAAIPTKAVEQQKSVLSFYRTFVQLARGAVEAGAVGSLTLSPAQRGQITRYADAEAAFLTPRRTDSSSQPPQ